MTRTKRLAIMLLAPVVLWSGYWVVAAYAVQQGPQLAMGPAAKAGVIVHFDRARVEGFPSRFELTLSELSVDAAQALSWDTQNVLVHAASHRPNEVSLDLSQPHRITGAWGEVQLDTAQAQITVLFKPTWSLGIGAITAGADGLRLSKVDEWGLDVGTVRARLTGYSDTEDAYRFDAELSDIDLSDLLVGLPDNYQMMRSAEIKGDVVFDAAWDRRALEQGAPTARAVHLEHAQFDFGVSVISAAGRLTVDDIGVLSGKIGVSVAQWRDVFELAQQLGYIEPGLENFFLSLLTDMAAQDGSPETLSLPLVIHEGRVSMGALSFGMLPKLQ